MDAAYRTDMKCKVSASKSLTQSTACDIAQMRCQNGNESRCFASRDELCLSLGEVEKCHNGIFQQTARPAPRRALHTHGMSRRGFTLVELLVVITIIGILASLVTVAAVAALKAARRGAIIAEINQINSGIVTLKNNAGAFPPNSVVDGNSEPIDESQVFNDFKRFMKQAFPRHREPDSLLALFVGQGSTADTLEGGMSAGESLVFWLGGFSSDPKYPISGEGGPSYLASAGAQDPIESRSWIYPFAIERLGPRDTNGFFDSAAGNRFIEFPDPKAPNDPSKRRRINFWQYSSSGSEQPYLYFDVSRYDPTAACDSPAASALSPNPLHVHAIKQLSSTPTTPGKIPIQFANKGKFQILHCGLDEEWGEDAFEQMSVHDASDPFDPDSYLLFPDGPFVGEVADTLTNFTEGTLEDSQP